MAPKVGEVMADLRLEGRDTIPEGFLVEDNLERRGGPSAPVWHPSNAQGPRQMPRPFHVHVAKV